MTGLSMGCSVSSVQEKMPAFSFLLRVSWGTKRAVINNVDIAKLQFCLPILVKMIKGIWEKNKDVIAVVYIMTWFLDYFHL